MSVIIYHNYSFIACWLRLSHLGGLSWSMPALSGISHKGHLKDRDGPKKTRSCSLRPLGHTASVDDMIGWLNCPILEHQRYDTSGHVLQVQGRQQTCCCQEPQATRSRKGYNRAYRQYTCRTDLRQFSILPQTLKDWNALPQETVHPPSHDTFSAGGQSSDSHNCSPPQTHSLVSFFFFTSPWTSIMVSYADCGWTLKKKSVTSLL